MVGVEPSGVSLVTMALAEGPPGLGHHRKTSSVISGSAVAAAAAVKHAATTAARASIAASPPKLPGKGHPLSQSLAPRT